MKLGSNHSGDGDLLGRIIEIITRYSGHNPAVLTRESKLRKLGLDSLDVCEILMDAEQEWQCEISDEAVENLVTVDDAEKLIMQLRSERENKL